MYNNRDTTVRDQRHYCLGLSFRQLHTQHIQWGDFILHNTHEQWLHVHESHAQFHNIGWWCHVITSPMLSQWPVDRERTMVMNKAYQSWKGLPQAGDVYTLLKTLPTWPTYEDVQPVCTKVPTFIQESVSFIVDLDRLDNPDCSRWLC